MVLVVWLTVDSTTRYELILPICSVFRVLFQLQSLLCNDTLREVFYMVNRQGSGISIYPCKTVYNSMVESMSKTRNALFCTLIDSSHLLQPIA